MTLFVRRDFFFVGGLLMLAVAGVGVTLSVPPSTRAQRAAVVEEKFVDGMGSFHLLVRSGDRTACVMVPKVVFDRVEPGTVWHGHFDPEGGCDCEEAP